NIRISISPPVSSQGKKALKGSVLQAVILILAPMGVTLRALVGILSGYYGGKVDLLMQRLIDTVMAFPAIILALAIVAVAGASLRNVILALIVLMLPASARVVWAEALAVKEKDYVLAAR